MTLLITDDMCEIKEIADVITEAIGEIKETAGEIAEAVDVTIGIVDEITVIACVIRKAG